MNNFKNNKKKNYFEPITLKFITDNFQNGLENLREVCDEKYAYLFEDNDGNFASEPQARLNLVDWFANNIPVYRDKETQFNSLSCSYNKVNLKFTEFFSIGWFVYLDKETNVTSYTFFFVISSEKVKERAYDYLTSNGWYEDKNTKTK